MDESPGISPFLPDQDEDDPPEQADVPVDEAVRLLDLYIERTEGPPPAYASFTFDQKPTAMPQPFTGTSDLRDTIHDRNGRMVIIDPAFKLEQWLLAEAHVADQWPEHHCPTVPGRIIALVRWALDEPHGYFRR